MLPLYLAALARALAAHALALTVDLVLVTLLPFLPPHACGLIAVILAVITVETVWLLLEQRRDGGGGTRE